MSETMSEGKAVLEHVYKASYTFGTEELHEANFSVILECDRDPRKFDMMVYTRDKFLNCAINVCNWPIDTWTREQVRECVRIFYDEYIPCAQHLSYIVHDKFLVEKQVLYVDMLMSGELQTRHIDTDTSRIDIDGIADIIWNALESTCHCEEYVWYRALGLPSQRLEDGTFGICDSIMDCGYTEDPFPFVGAIDAFGDATDSTTDLYSKYLPTLMNLANATNHCI